MRLIVIFVLIQCVNACGKNNSQTDASVSFLDSQTSDSGLKDAVDPLDHTVTDTESVTAISAAEMAKACVIWNSCGGGSGVNWCLKEGFSGWTYRETQKDIFPTTKIKCIASKKGCSGIASCLGIKRADYMTCQNASAAFCDGNELVQCDGNNGIRFDCQQRFGVACQEVKTKTDVATGCSNNAPCTYAGKQCQGDRVVECINGVEFLKKDCNFWGLICQNGSCTGPDESCSCNAPFCEGDTIGKGIAGFRVRMSCTQFGSSFACNEGEFGGRCLQGLACEPDNVEQTICSGNSIEVCNAGKLEKVDCIALGFAGCLQGVCSES
jgi:hypothetical protein